MTKVARAPLPADCTEIITQCNNFAAENPTLSPRLVKILLDSRTVEPDRRKKYLIEQFNECGNTDIQTNLAKLTLALNAADKIVVHNKCTQIIAKQIEQNNSAYDIALAALLDCTVIP